MQCTSAAVSDLKSVEFAYSTGTEDWIYINFVVAHFCGQCKWRSFTFTFMHLADAFSQSNLQKRNRAINQRANNHCNNAKFIREYSLYSIKQLCLWNVLIKHGNRYVNELVLRVWHAEELCLQLLFERCDGLSGSRGGWQLIPPETNREGESFRELLFCLVVREQGVAHLVT